MARSRVIHSTRLIWLSLLVGIGLQSLAQVETLIQIGPVILEEIKQRFGTRAHNRVEQWEQLMATNKDKSTRAKLELVNNFFNRIRYKTDQEHWGAEDYWATPIELLSTNGGDCEDYSIAKYFTLRALGIADEDLRLTYVNALELGQAHMVLTYYGENKLNPLVLDNLTPWIQLASKRTDLAPVYSFNGSGLWKSRERGRGDLLGTAENLDQWANLLTRLPPEYLSFPDIDLVTNN